MAFKDTDKLCEIIQIKFDVIEHMHRVLKPLYQATVVLQRTDFTMSDFYATWIQLEDSLQKIEKKHKNDPLALSLLRCLSKRKQKLIDNTTMLCALALDPRFYGDLSSHQKSQAIDSLLNLWRRIQMIPRNGDIETGPELSDSELEISIQNTTILSKFKHAQCEEDTAPSVLSTNVFVLSEKISSFMCSTHIMPEGTIYDFWLQNENFFPELFQLSQLIFSICPTQSIVERAFSTLSHIFPSHRNNLNENLLNDIMIISLNEDLFRQVNEEDRVMVMKDEQFI